MPKSLNLDRLATVQVVPLTPLSPDAARVLPDLLGRLAQQLYEAGIRVLLPAAGTGEFHSLTADEVVACVAATRQSVGSDAVVMAPVGFGLPHALARRPAAGPARRAARPAGLDRRRTVRRH